MIKRKLAKARPRYNFNSNVRIIWQKEIFDDQRVYQYGLSDIIFNPPQLLLRQYCRYTIGNCRT